MKQSKYNFFFEDAGKILGYNIKSGAFISLDKESYDYFRRISIHNNIKIDISDEFIKELNLGGFLVDENTDETEVLKLMSRLVRYSNDAMNLTILPTIGCNFDCPYCYENKHESVMNESVKDKILEFIEKQMPQLKSLNITWFGGEPLIAKEVIYELSDKIISLCNKFGCHYSADIITNGYLLDENVSKELKSRFVNNAQITLDGSKNVHDSKRYKIDKSPTFDTIVSNIIEASKHLNITIRVNIDKSNANDVKELIDYLSKLNLSDKININFAKVHAEGSIISFDQIKFEKERLTEFRNQSIKGLMKTREFSRIEPELYRYAMDKGFRLTNTPTQKCNACTADLSNSFVIEYNGDLQKCWQTVGIASEKIGTVFDGVKLNNNLMKWINYDPFSNPMCKNCKVLPICMGWCPVKWFNKEVYKLDYNYDPCKTIKYNLREMLLLYYRSLRENKHVASAMCNIG